MQRPVYGVLAVTLVFTLLGTNTAMAAAAGGALPWDTAMTAIAASISGPVAYTISLAAFVLGGGTYALSAQMNGFAQTLFALAMGVGIVAGAAALLQSFYGVGATLSGDAAQVTATAVILTGLAAISAAQEAMIRWYRSRVDGADSHAMSA